MTRGNEFGSPESPGEVTSGLLTMWSLRGWPSLADCMVPYAEATCKPGRWTTCFSFKAEDLDKWHLQGGTLRNHVRAVTFYFYEAFWSLYLLVPVGP